MRIKTLKRKTYLNETRKNRSSSASKIQKFEQEIVLKFLQLLNMVKLYHWKTHSYAVHKATDNLYSKLNNDIDKFVEVLLGKIGNRVDLTHVKSISLNDYNSVDQLNREMQYYKNYLVDLDTNKVMNMMSNTDLFNIRDEILADINQFLYLLTFK